MRPMHRPTSDDSRAEATRVERQPRAAPGSPLPPQSLLPCTPPPTRQLRSPDACSDARFCTRASVRLYPDPCGRTSKLVQG